MERSIEFLFLANMSLHVGNVLNVSGMPVASHPRSSIDDVKLVHGI